MRFIVLVKADEDTVTGVMPSKRLLTETGKYNEEFVNAAVLLAGEGLHPSSTGVRVRFSGDRRTVIDGPFAATKKLITGLWLIQVKSKEDAVDRESRAQFFGCRATWWRLPEMSAAFRRCRRSSIVPRGGTPLMTPD